MDNIATEILSPLFAFFLFSTIVRLGEGEGYMRTPLLTDAVLLAVIVFVLCVVIDLFAGKKIQWIVNIIVTIAVLLLYVLLTSV